MKSFSSSATGWQEGRKAEKSHWRKGRWWRARPRDEDEVDEEEEHRKSSQRRSGVNVIKLFPSSPMTRPSKLEGLPLETLSSQVLRIWGQGQSKPNLSDASFLGKLLVLPANVRLDWKVIARYKHSSLFGLVICNKEKKFYNIDTWCQCYKSYFLVIDVEAK